MEFENWAWVIAAVVVMPAIGLVAMIVCLELARKRKIKAGLPLEAKWEGRGFDIENVGGVDSKGFEP